MEIREYLFRNHIQVKELAKSSGLHQQVVSNIKCKRIPQPSFKTCKKIVDATNHHVGYADLMPDIYEAIIKEYIRKTKGKVSE